MMKEKEKTIKESEEMITRYLNLISKHIDFYNNSPERKMKTLHLSMIYSSSEMAFKLRKLINDIDLPNVNIKE